MKFQSQFDILQSILGKITDGFFVVDRRWNILMANDAAAKIASQPADLIIGKNLWDVVPQYRGTDIQRRYLTAMRTGQTVVFYSFLVDFGFWVETRLYPSADGLTSYFRMLAAAEVDELKLESPEEHMPVPVDADELEESAAIVSHDLKEPLKSVALWLDLAGHEKNNEGSREKLLGKASVSVKRCLSMVESLLENSRVATGEIQVEDVPAGQVLESVQENLSRLISEHNATIQCENLPKVKANYTYLLRIFQNLISNSIKYRHPDRKPVVRVAHRDLTEAHEFSVEDNGRGFESSDKQKVFQLYERANPSDDISGQGIGLAIVKKLVELHGGRVEIFSKAGEMTRVVFTLPKIIARYDEKTAHH
jgi:PAS domain S-box-containing protein